MCRKLISSSATGANSELIQYKMSVAQAGSTFVQSLMEGAEEVKKNLKEAFEEGDGIINDDGKKGGSNDAKVEAEEEVEKENENLENGGNIGHGGGDDDNMEEGNDDNMDKGDDGNNNNDNAEEGKSSEQKEEEDGSKENEKDNKEN